MAYGLHIRWTSTTLIGLLGIVGAPIYYYFEWVLVQQLNGVRNSRITN
ncbi:MAG: hypothetical protein WCB79_00435 [Halobacteriota archaeon]